MSYHTPARFPTQALQEIRRGAAQLFKRLGLQDFARFDGWYIHSSSSTRLIKRGEHHEGLIGEFEEGAIVFSDMNMVLNDTDSDFQRLYYLAHGLLGVLIQLNTGLLFCLLVFFAPHRLVGWNRPVFCFNKPRRLAYNLSNWIASVNDEVVMAQTVALCRQSSVPEKQSLTQCLQVGFSHADIVRLVLFHALSRFAIPLPSFVAPVCKSQLADPLEASKKKVHVIFGGDSSERQVSLMSGTNVWLNLRAAEDVSSVLSLSVRPENT